jgi:hypothetical protein
VRTSWQAADACLRMPAPFFQKKSGKEAKNAKISVKKWTFFKN